MLGNCTYANTEISKFFLTKWTTDVATNFTTGTTQGGEISAYVGLTESWGEIVLNTAIVSYNQSLNAPGPNGLTYSENVSIVMPQADADKWAELVQLLTERYIIVFKDANGNWFTLGWRFGARVLAYVLEENEYNLTFSNDFTTNLLTSISSTYVSENIL